MARSAAARHTARRHAASYAARSNASLAAAYARRPAILAAFAEGLDLRAVCERTGAGYEEAARVREEGARVATRSE